MASTVGVSDISLQRPTTTNTAIATMHHGCRRQKFPPSAPHEALRSALTSPLNKRRLAKQAGIILWGVEGACGPQNAPMLWQCIIAGTKERFKDHTHTQTSKKLYPLAWGVVTYPFDKLARGARPHVVH